MCKPRAEGTAGKIKLINCQVMTGEEMNVRRNGRKEISLNKK